jgi:hypothetical protein
VVSAKEEEEVEQVLNDDRITLETEILYANVTYGPITIPTYHQVFFGSKTPFLPFFKAITLYPGGIRSHDP